jgi:hypothetical protein
MRFANKKLQLVSAAAAFALSWIGSAGGVCAGRFL